MLHKIRKMHVRGALYGKIHRKEARKPTRAGQALAILRKGEKVRFRVSVNKSLITLPPVAEIKTSNLIYPLIRPYSYANIKFDTADNSLIYNILEPRLSEKEKYIMEKIHEGLIQIIDVSLGDVNHSDKMLSFLEKSVTRLLDEYNIKLTEQEYIKIMYYIFRDFVGLNRIEALLSDPYIEDIGCLPEHEKMFVRADGIIKLTTIGEIIDEEIPHDDKTVVSTPSKHIEVLSFNPKTMAAEYKKIKGFLRKENRHGYYFDVRTTGGNHINVSPDHPMLVLDASGINVKKADALKEGDYVLRLKGIKDTSLSESIDLIQEFSKINNKMRVKGAKNLISNNLQTARLLGVDNKLIALWKQNDSMPIWAYIMLEKDVTMRKNLKISVGQGVKNWLPAVIEPNEELAMLIGLFLAEGYYETSGVSFAFGKHEKNLHSFTLNLADRVFGTTTSIIEHKTSTVVYCGGKTLRMFFENILKLGNSSYNKRIPDIAYKWDENIQRNLVKGYFIGDGYMRITDNKRKAVMATASRDLVLGIRYILYRLGIFTRVDKRAERFANTWEISIESGRPLTEFYNMINGESMYGGTERTNTHLYPSFLFNKEDYTGKPRKSVSRQIQSGGRIGLKYAIKTSNMLLQTLLHGDIHPVRIIEINPVKYTKPFYDIEVADNSNFMHGDFIFTHNCDGVNVPVYVVHQKFGSIKTNVIYTDAKELRDFVTKLAERCDRYISYAEPLLDGSLPDGARVQASLASDVTTRGPTFSIRKFRSEPLSPVDMLRLNTASAEMLAYLWFLIENGMNILIAGGVSTGKTSLLNGISFFIPPEAKIVSIEDTRELNLPHENWIPGAARSGFTGSGVGEVSMYELLRESFRQNPDYLIVGEIRGKEAYVMFQAMASGHPSISTVHAGSVDDLMKRLQTKPINLSAGLIESLDLVIIMIHAREHGKSARRVKEIVEIEDIDVATGQPVTNKAFVWLPANDSFEYRSNSWLLERISTQKGIPMNTIIKEIAKRKKFLQWLYENNKTDMKEVGKYMMAYYRNPEKINRILAGERE